MTDSAQAEFDDKYVSSTELCATLSVSRAAIADARRRGVLPEPVRIDRPNGTPHAMLWLREVVGPIVEKWRLELEARRGQADA